jgi:hypothetical protein
MSIGDCFALDEDGADIQVPCDEEDEIEVDPYELWEEWGADEEEEEEDDWDAECDCEECRRFWGDDDDD